MKFTQFEKVFPKVSTNTFLRTAKNLTVCTDINRENLLGTNRF